jgi:hypothetical protein
VLNGLNAPTGGHVIAFEVIKVAQSIEHFSILLFDDPAINEIEEIAQSYGLARKENSMAKIARDRVPTRNRAQVIYCELLRVFY